MSGHGSPWRAVWWTWRDTTIAIVVVTLLSAPFLFIVVREHVDEALDPTSLPTCMAWELTAESVEAPEATRALSIAEAHPDETLEGWEILEKDGAIWLEGCFPDSSGGRSVADALEREQLFTGSIAIEWPDLSDRLMPALFESIDAYLLPIALATPLGLGLTALFFIRRRGLNVTARLPFGRALVLGLGAAVGAYLLVSVVERLLALVGLEQQEQVWIVSIVESGGPKLAGLAVFAVLIGPFGEELFFRRYLFEAIDRFSGRLWAYGLSTAAFALVHFNPAALIAYFLTGLLLAAVYERTRSLATAYATHAAFNALTLAQLVLLT